MTLQKVYNSSTSSWDVVDTGAAPTSSGYIYSSTTGKLTTGITAPVSPATGDIWVDTNSLPENLAPSSIVWKETPTGTVNGSNTAYTTAQGYVSGTLQVFINGVANSGLTTESAPGSGGFTLSPAPITGDNISVQYQVRVTATGNADTVDNYHANATPTANTIPVLDGNAKLPTTIITNPYKFSMYRSAAYTTVSSAATILPFDAKSFDTSTNTDIVTNKGRFTVPVSGFYQLNGLIMLASSVTRGVVIFNKNGTEITRGGDGAGFAFEASPLLQLTAGDYIDMTYYTTSSVALQNTGPTGTHFSGFLMCLT